MYMLAYTDSTTHTTCFGTQGSHLEAICNSTCMHIVTMVTQSTGGRDKHLYKAPLIPLTLGMEEVLMLEVKACSFYE